MRSPRESHDLLHSLFIKDYQSEPYHQHQNKAEIVLALPNVTPILS